MLAKIRELTRKLDERNLELRRCRQTEEALRASERKFSRLFHSAPAVIAITTLAGGKWLDVNDAFLQSFGYRREEVIGRTAYEIGIWENIEDRARVVEAVSARGRVKNLEVRFRCKNGGTFVGLMSAELIDINDEPCLLSLVKDITERKRMEEKIEELHTSLSARTMELEAANGELEAFNYTVSHDLRGPLTIVSGYCQMMRELCGDGLGNEGAECLEGIYDGVRKMSGLIDTLLSFARLSRSDIHREAVDLSRMAREIAADLGLLDPRRRLMFAIADGIVAHGDARLLRVVLENLLGNAWKYTAANETAVIEFGTVEVGGVPAYIVRDNGVGFDTERAAGIFTPFHRLHSDEEYAGHGIGLATVQRIVLRHGGKVWAEGAVGQGAAFYFTMEPGRR